MHKKIFLSLLMLPYLLYCKDQESSQCNNQLEQLFRKFNKSQDESIDLQKKLFKESNENQNKSINLQKKLFKINNELVELFKKSNTKHDESIDLQKQLLAINQLFLQLKAEEVQQKVARAEAMHAAMQAEEEKSWYEKTWDILAPGVKNAVINFIISAMAAKIINTAVSGTDYVTGDLPAQNGYGQFAIFAGTFIAADSFQSYFKKRDTQVLGSDPEVRRIQKDIDDLMAKDGDSLRIIKLEEEFKTLMLLSNAAHIRKQRSTLDRVDPNIPSASATAHEHPKSNSTSTLKENGVTLDTLDE